MNLEESAEVRGVKTLAALENSSASFCLSHSVMCTPLEGGTAEEAEEEEERKKERERERERGGGVIFLHRKVIIMRC